MNRWLTYAVGLMIAFMLVGGSFRPNSEARPPRPAAGYPAPDFLLTDVAGQSVRLSDYRGKPPQAVAADMQSKGYNWRVPFDADGTVNEAYGVISVPTSFFIDRAGVIRAKYMGPMSLPQLKDSASLVTGR